MIFLIKGVNKQVLEINEIDNTFFEKAIFFVKPEYSGLSEGRLREMAQKKLNSTGAPPKPIENDGKAALKKHIKTALIAIFGIISGILISYIIK